MTTVPEPSRSEPLATTESKKTGFFKQNSTIWKLVTIGVLMLVMLIPLGMIQGIIGERQQNKEQASAEIAASWGWSQVITGPVLAVPYYTQEKYVDDNNKEQQRRSKRFVYLLPSVFQLSGSLDPQIRKRGIFESPIYTADITMNGHFDLSLLGNYPHALVWDEAFLVMGIADPKGLNQAPSILVQQSPQELHAGLNGTNVASSGVYAPLDTVQLQPGRQSVPFSVSMSLKGLNMLGVVPVGQQSTIQIQSSWTSPRFFGSVLPTKTPDISESGFQAVWDIPALAREYGQVQTSESEKLADTFIQSSIGVELLTPVDFYRQAERATKYGVLFLALTFGTYFIFEVISRFRMHPFQYFLIGCAMTLFYLLLLALAEVIDFAIAYMVASLATIVTIGLYSHALLGSLRRYGALWISGLLTALYGYLYVLLRLEELSLLFGAMGLFFVLVVSMYVTRHVDWYCE